MAAVAHDDLDLHFAWQAWHLVTWTSILGGRRGTYCNWAGSGGVLGSRLCAWVSVVAMVDARLCVAGVALGDGRGLQVKEHDA